MLTGLPWDRKYVQPFHSALLSSPELQVSPPFPIYFECPFSIKIPTGASFTTLRWVHLRRRLHAERLSISIPHRTQPRLGLDFRDVPIRTAVSGGTPDHRESDVVLLTQCHPPRGLAAQLEAPLRLPPLLCASRQRSARTRLLKALPRDPRRPLPLLYRTPHRPAGRRRHLRS